jgi:hypothetical protein
MQEEWERHISERAAVRNGSTSRLWDEIRTRRNLHDSAALANAPSREHESDYDSYYNSPEPERFVQMEPAVPGSAENRQYNPQGNLPPINALTGEPDVAKKKTKHPKQSRTLLYIVKKLKKDWTSLIKNPTAYTWQWLQIHYSNYFEEEKNFRIADNRIVRGEQVDKLYTEIQERYIKILNLVANKKGDEFVFANHKFRVKSQLKAYWLTGKLKWVPAEDFQVMKDEETVIWDPLIQDWAHMGTFRSVHSGEADNIQTKYRSVAKAPNDFPECPRCAHTWMKGSLKYKEELDQEVCPQCFSTLIVNRKFSLGTIYGGYHSHKDWTFLPQKIKNDPGFPMGIELEVQCKEASLDNISMLSAWDIYQQQLLINPEWHNIYFERDGSLSDSSVEIISNPMTLDFHKEYWSKMLPVIKEHCAGWDVKKYNAGTHLNYGIHITFHRKNWSDLQLARLTKFVEAKGNKDFIHAIAQRTCNYGGRAVAGSTKAHLNEVVQIEAGKIKGGLNRNQSINVKGDGKFVEVRMFNSTLNYESFLKNIEFLDAFRAWCKETPLHFDYVNFLNWLGTRPHHKYRYEHLISYLSRPKFFVKGLDKGIANPWMTLIKGQRGQLNLFSTDITEDNACV